MDQMIPQRRFWPGLEVANMHLQEETGIQYLTLQRSVDTFSDFFLVLLNGMAVCNCNKLRDTQKGYFSVSYEIRAHLFILL